MNKQRFRVIVILMGISLAGLIVLQASWIRHDVLIKQKQFDQSVMLALNDIVDRVEQRENMQYVVKNFIRNRDTSYIQHTTVDTVLEDFDLEQWITEPEPTPAAPVDINEVKAAIHEHLHVNKEEEEECQDAMQESETHIATAPAVPPAPPSPPVRQTYPELTYHFNRDSTINIKIENDVHQHEVIAIQTQRHAAHWDSLVEETEQRVKAKMKRLNTLMQRFSFQVSEPNKNALKRINPNVLDTIIHEELEHRDLPTDYNFGIYSAGDSMLYCKRKEDKSVLLQTGFNIPLFPHDIFQHNDQLLLKLDGKLNFILMSMWPMLLSSGLFTLIIVLGFAYTVHTIFKQKRLADIKNDFINNMTHEFKTPIATIALANESIKDERVHGDEQKLNYYTTVIKDENQRMLSQVENVLRMAQIDKGELRLKKEVTDMHDVIQNAISKVQLQVEQREGKTELYFNANEHTVFGDGNHLLNVVINLFDNAIKYSIEPPEIKIYTLNENGQFVFKVKDNGIGMSKETLKQIFITFYRAQTGNVHDVKGFGLGLSYVKAIVEAHGGTVTAESDPDPSGHGSTFTLTLPLYQS